MNLKLFKITLIVTICLGICCCLTCCQSTEHIISENSDETEIIYETEEFNFDIVLEEIPMSDTSDELTSEETANESDTKNISESYDDNAADTTIETHETIKHSETSKSQYAETQDVSTHDTETDTTDNTNDSDNSFRPWYNIGKNKQLRGTPVIYALFMDDDESQWNSALVDRFIKYEIEPAAAFLENEAKKWNINLDLEIQAYATSLDQGYTLKYEGIVNKDLRESPSTKDVLVQAATDFGYASADEFYDAESASNNNNEIIFLCIFNKDGVCYTRNQIKNAPVSVPEEAIIFRWNLNTIILSLTGTRASVVAHEILHKFGAQDYYTPQPRKSLAQKHYPTDIMLSQYSDLKRNTLGDLVAYSIGWTDTIPDICYIDEWWQE